MAVPFLKNPRQLVVSNPRKKKGKTMPRGGRRRGTRKGQVRKTARRAYTPRSEPRRKRTPATRRRRINHGHNPLVVRNSPRRRRRNPILPGGMIGQMIMVASGYLAAPMLANLIPWHPGSQAGEYLKRAGAVIVGSQLLGKVAGRKYGNALFVGGMISIAVDVLRNYVPALSPGAPAVGANSGMDYYFPPNAELAAMYAGGNGESALATASGMAPGESVGRFANRF